MMTANDKLLKLYSSKFSGLRNLLHEYNKGVTRENRATNPFLISLPDNYKKYKNRLMIFGQETNYWCGECGQGGEFSDNIERSIDVYNNFYWGGHIYRGPFRNEFNRVKRKVCSISDTIVSWNNINKIGRLGKGNIAEINKIQFEHFLVVKNELEIFNPNIVVLFTGNYDDFVRRQIGEFSSVKIYQNLYQYEFQNNFEDTFFLKTNHPNTLYRQSLNRKVMPRLIEEIKKRCM